MVPNRYKVMITTWNSKQPVLNGRLLKTSISHREIRIHPIETTIYKWMFQVLGMYVVCFHTPQCPAFCWQPKSEQIPGLVEAGEWSDRAFWKRTPQGVTPVTPGKIDMEPKNHPIEKENHLPNPLFLGTMWIFQGVFFFGTLKEKLAFR